MGAEMKHVHTCPKCFDHIACDNNDCVIEPNLGLTKAGEKRGAHAECGKCEVVWCNTDSRDFIRSLEYEIAKIGFHVGLRGSVLMQGQSNHDLDLVIYPHDSTNVRTDELYAVLCRSGLERQKTVAQVHAGWRAKGSADEKPYEIWTFVDRVVDIFYAGFDPYVSVS